MILGKSVDKAQIKKIAIRAWSLSDEIETTLNQLLSENQGTIPEDKLQILKSFYEATPLSELSKKPTLTIIQGGKSEQRPQPLAPAPVPMEAQSPTQTSAQTQAQTHINQPEQTQAPAQVQLQNTEPPKQELDPFEAAMLAEVEAQKKAQNEAGKTNITDEATLKAQAELQELQALSIASQGSSLSLAPAPSESEKKATNNTTEKRPITADDFLKFRKDNIRKCPPENKTSVGFAILNDINFDTVMFFSVKPFKPGQDIVLQFDIHKSFTVIAVVTNICQISVGSRIITENAPKYRITARLKHEHVGDRTLIRNFLKSVDATLNPA